MSSVIITSIATQCSVEILKWVLAHNDDTLADARAKLEKEKERAEKEVEKAQKKLEKTQAKAQKRLDKKREEYIKKSEEVKDASQLLSGILTKDANIQFLKLK